MIGETPRVESFVIRFVQDRADEANEPALSHWRGVIVHVQSNEEKSFIKIADAVAFMSRFIADGDLSSSSEQE